jgi:secondary thiamine-phosphate synthase enzyme
MIHSLAVKTKSRCELVELTEPINRLIEEQGVREGLCVVYVPHTTAGVTVNENADPDVAQDLLDRLSQLAPKDAGYRHGEGNADSHIKASLIGSSATLPVSGGQLKLGRWQGVFLCEFDGPRRRSVEVR